METGIHASWITFFILTAGLVIAAGAFLHFLRSRENQRRASEALVGTGHHNTGPTADGALPDLLAILVIALVAMALLTFGYATR